MLESDVQRLILDYLNKRGDCFAWRNESVGIYANGKWRKKAGFAIKGVSDILGVFSSGQILAVEVKRKGATDRDLSPEQKVFLEKINRMNGIAFWADSVEMTEIKINEKKNVRETSLSDLSDHRK